LKSHGTHRTGDLVWPGTGLDGCRKEKMPFLHRGSTPSSPLCGESQINQILLISIREKFYEVKNAAYTVFVSLALAYSWKWIYEIGIKVRKKNV